jgi:hypothetical protein
VLLILYTLTTPLAYNTNYYWTVSAYNAIGEGTQATVRSFTTRADIQQLILCPIPKALKKVIQMVQPILLTGLK